MTNIMTKKAKLIKLALGAMGVATIAMSTTATANDRYTPAAYASAPTIGQPYTVAGVTYTPRHQPSYDQVGNVSWYGDRFHGKLTASGETYNKHAMTAAHKTLPLGSLVRVTNLNTGQSLVVRINDRGPFVGNGLIDLSEAAATQLGYNNSNVGHVRIQFVTPMTAPQSQYTAPQRVQTPYNVAGSMRPQTMLPAAPIAIPNAQAPATSQVTLTVKGPLHMASSRSTDAQPKFIRAVNRVTYTTKS